MKKNILLLLLAAGLIFVNSGCTSKESTEDDQAIENADVEKIDAIGEDDAALSETPPPTDAPATDATATAEAPADEMSLDATLDASTDTTANTDVAATETPATPTDTTTPTADDSSLSLADSAPPVTDAQLAPDPALSAPADTPAPTADITETPVADTSSSTPVESAFTPSPVSSPAPGSALKKISATAPYQAKDGGWVNTVYIARPGEKLAEISQKIFGADKTKDLKAIAENNYLKWRSPKGGDKIYYVSPNRPDDSARTILFYEDMGMVPETYVAKKGDSLRKISKELLGYDNAWKEIWTSNMIESKTSLKDGDTIRYWKTGSTEVMAMAPPSPPPAGANPPMPPPPSGATIVDSSSAPQQTATTTPPAPTDTALPPPPPDANATLPPPPTDTALAAAPTDTAVPPPPPADEPPPPPPPPSDDAAAAPADGEKKDLDAAAAEEEGEEGELDTDTLMSMGALGVLLAMLVFVIIRKKKQKSQMGNLEMNA